MQSRNFQGRFCPPDMNSHLYDSSGQRVMPNSGGISNPNNSYPSYHGGTDYSFMTPAHQHQGEYNMYQHGFHGNHISHNMQYGSNQNISHTPNIAHYSSSTSDVYSSSSSSQHNQDPYNSSVNQSGVHCFQPIWDNSTPNNSMDSSIINSSSHNQSTMLGPRNSMMCSPPPVLRSPSSYPLQGSPGYPTNVSTAQLNQMSSPNHSPHSWNTSTSPGLGFPHGGNNGNSGIKSPPTAPSPNIYSPTRSPNYIKPFSPPVPAKSPSQHIPSPQQSTSKSSYDVSVNQHSFNMVPHNKSSPPLAAQKTCNPNPLQSLQKMVMFSESHPVSPIARANKEIIGNASGQICTPPSPNINSPMNYGRDVDCNVAVSPHVESTAGPYPHNIADGKMIGSDFRHSVNYSMSSKEHSRNATEYEIYGALSNPTTPISESSNASTLSETRSLDSAKNEPAICGEKSLRRDDASNEVFLSSTNFRPNVETRPKNTVIFEENPDPIQVVSQNGRLFEGSKIQNHTSPVESSVQPSEVAADYRMPRCGDSPSTYIALNMKNIELISDDENDDDDDDDDVEEIEQIPVRIRNNINNLKDNVNKIENEKMKPNINILSSSNEETLSIKGESAMDKLQVEQKETVNLLSDTNSNEQPHRHWRKRTSLTAVLNPVEQLDNDIEKSPSKCYPNVEEISESEPELDSDKYVTKKWNQIPVINSPLDKSVNGPIVDSTSPISKPDSTSPLHPKLGSTSPLHTKLGAQSHSSLIELKDNLNKMQKRLGDNPSSAFLKKQNYGNQSIHVNMTFDVIEYPTSTINQSNENNNVDVVSSSNKSDDLHKSLNSPKLNSISPAKTEEKDFDTKSETASHNGSASDRMNKKRRGRPVGSKNRFKVHRRRKNEILEERSKFGNNPKKNNTLHMKKKRNVDNPVSGEKNSGVFQGPCIRVVGTRNRPKSFTVINTNIQKDEEKAVKKKKLCLGSNISHKIKGTLSSQPPPNAAPAGKHWVCAMCGKGSNYMGLGDLFGPYFLDTSINSHSEPINENSNNSSDMNASDSSEYLRKARNKRKSSDSIESITKEGFMPKKLKFAKLKKIGMAISSPTNFQPSHEIWVHEDCIVWSHGVYLVGNKIYGLKDAAQVAKEMICSKCKLNGATLGCLNKGCTEQYHYICALEKDCQMDEEKFSLVCPKHKDKRKVNQPTEGVNAC